MLKRQAREIEIYKTVNPGSYKKKENCTALFTCFEMVKIPPLLQ
jgi:hypothetical protein